MAASNHVCEHCGRVFPGRADARFCSPSCRVSDWQMVKRKERKQKRELEKSKGA